MATNERLRLSCHEAGHAIAAIELGGTCNGVILTNAGGQTIVDGLYSDRAAFMYASGPAAEVLADRFEPPAVNSFIAPDELSATITPGDTSVLAMLCSVADIEQLPRSAVSDERELALWSITGREDEPESWAGRVAFAKRVAAEIVSKNTQAILKVAGALYERGKLSREEIKTLLEVQ